MVIAGIIGAIAGVFAGGFIAAARCQVGPECLGAAFLGVGLGAILVESCVMVLAAHIANQSRGNLLLTFLPTILLAVPIPLVLLLGFTAVLVVERMRNEWPGSGVGLREGTACHFKQMKGGAPGITGLEKIP